MRARSMMRAGLMLASAWLADPATAAGRLTIDGAWIRLPPPGAMMLAGYAVLRNSGDAAVIVHAARSKDFGAISIHETVEADGVERMRPLGEVEVAPGASVAFAPGGKHLMLMHPSRELASGDVVQIHFDTNDAAGADADFAVRDDAPGSH